jgi:hypothetical protein
MCGEERNHGVSPVYFNPFTLQHLADGTSLLPVSRRKLASRDKMKNYILTREQNRYVPMIYTIWVVVGTSFDLLIALVRY